MHPGSERARRYPRASAPHSGSGGAAPLSASGDPRLLLAQATPSDLTGAIPGSVSPCAPARVRSAKLRRGLVRDRVGAQAPPIVPAGDRSAALPPLTSGAAGLELARGRPLAGRDREALGGASGSARLKLKLRHERGAGSCSSTHEFLAAVKSHRARRLTDRGNLAGATWPRL